MEKKAWTHADPGPRAPPSRTPPSRTSGSARPPSSRRPWRPPAPRRAALAPLTRATRRPGLLKSLIPAGHEDSTRERPQPPTPAGPARASASKAVRGRPARSPGWVVLASGTARPTVPTPGPPRGAGWGAWRAGRGRARGRSRGRGGGVRRAAQGPQWPPRSEAACRERPGAEGLTGHRGAQSR